MIPAKPSPGERKYLVDAAMGRKPFDLLITNIQLVNVFSGEIYPAGIGIAGAYIVFAGECCFALPGFTDPHEIANVMGIRGVEYMLQAGRGLPMYLFAMSPYCVQAPFSAEMKLPEY